MSERAARIGARCRRFGTWRPAGLCLALVMPCAVPVWGATLQDSFASRETVTTSSGQVDGNNAAATLEPDEPLHARKPGGRSVWISWVAPADGVATFETSGSRFDTLLAAYYLNPGDFTVDKLHELARNDDAVGLEPASLIQFGALAGHQYEIAVDGYRAASGDLRLRWDFVNATSPPPVVVSVPDDQAARQGDPVTLTVNLQTSPELDLQWRFNDNSLEEKGPTLLIPSLQATNVGRYTLRIRIGAVRFETTPTEVQINSEGQTNVLALDKLLDAGETALIGGDDLGGGTRSALRLGAVRRLGPPPVGVVRGYNGTQIFNTTYATPDPSEPAHCGQAAGSSYWLFYQPPTNGTLVLDTAGSTYDPVLELYTFDGVLTSYGDLISLGCDHAATGTPAIARLETPVFRARQYVVVVDGWAGARGLAALNYQLQTNRPPTAPELLETPAPRHVVPGSAVTWAPSVAGSPPLRFAWSKDGVALSQASTPVLALGVVGVGDAGSYTLTATNDLGGFAATWVLRVLVPPRCVLQSVAGPGFRLSIPTVRGQNYLVEAAAVLGGPWIPQPQVFTGDDAIQALDLPAGDASFFRIRVE